MLHVGNDCSLYWPPRILSLHMYDVPQIESNVAGSQLLTCHC